MAFDVQLNRCTVSRGDFIAFWAYIWDCYINPGARILGPGLSYFSHRCDVKKKEECMKYKAGSLPHVLHYIGLII